MRTLPRLPVPLQILIVVAVIVAGFVLPFGFFHRFTLPQARELWAFRPFHKNMEDRRAAFLGVDYRFMSFVRNTVPPTAVILLPDQNSPSPLDRDKAKLQNWAEYFLYPRKVLYTHQQANPLFRFATWLVVDDSTAVAWIYPPARPPWSPGDLLCVPFDMAAYMDAVDGGRVPRQYLPPARPMRVGSAP